jgi:hypothetical protein
MEFKTHNDGDINVSFTCLQGHLEASYEDLCTAFGPHHTNVDDMKCDAGWDLMFSDGTVACIYNWKNGHNYMGSDGKAIKDMTYWNIGAKHAWVAGMVEQALRAAVRQAA